jgi:hypothetical protein
MGRDAAITVSDRQIMATGMGQLVGQFLLDREGVVRWILTPPEDRFWPIATKFVARPHVGYQGQTGNSSRRPDRRECRVGPGNFTPSRSQIRT